MDTTTYEVFEWPYLNILRFKLDADSGDKWIALRDEFIAVRADIVFVFYTHWLGQLVLVKKIAYCDSASGLYLESKYLATKFGIIMMEYDPPGSFYYLRGAIINGVKYGTIINIEHNHSFKSKSFPLE